MLVTHSQFCVKRLVIPVVAPWKRVSSSNQNRKCPCTLCKRGCRYPVRGSVSLREIASCFVSSPREPGEDASGLVSAHLKWKCTRRFPRHHPLSLYIYAMQSAWLGNPGSRHPLCSVIRRRD